LAIWKPRQRPAPDHNHAVAQPANQLTSQPTNEALAARLKARFGGRLWLGATRLLVPGERDWFDALDELGRRHDIPRLACGDVRLATRDDKPLLDVLTALKLGQPVADCGLALAASG